MAIERMTLLFVALFLIGTLYAQESFDIDKSIERIKNAPQEDRRELMNRFKKMLAKMNRAQRMKAIMRLKEGVLGGEGLPEHPVLPDRSVLDAVGIGGAVQAGHGIDDRVINSGSERGRHGGRP